MPRRTQYSRRTDATLEKLSRRLGAAEKQKDEAEAEHKKAWEEIFEIFDEFGHAGEPARFLSPDGFYLQRQARRKVTSLNEEAFRQAIFEHFPKRVANKLWKEITIPKIIPELLERAILEGRLTGSWVEELLPHEEKGFARIRQPWTEKDKELAVIFDLQEDK